LDWDWLVRLIWLCEGLHAFKLNKSAEFRIRVRQIHHTFRQLDRSLNTRDRYIRDCNVIRYSATHIEFSFVCEVYYMDCLGQTVDVRLNDQVRIADWPVNWQEVVQSLHVVTRDRFQIQNGLAQLTLQFFPVVAIHTVLVVGLPLKFQPRF